MSDHFDPKKLMQKATEIVSKERKVIGGSYEVVFYFTSGSDFLVFTATGLVQAKGKDHYHVYVKPWEKSLFASFTASEVLEKFSSKIENIEVKGCGNSYLKLFSTYDAFLNWLGFPRQLDLLVPQR